VSHGYGARRAKTKRNPQPHYDQDDGLEGDQYDTGMEMKMPLTSPAASNEILRPPRDQVVESRKHRRASPLPSRSRREDDYEGDDNDEEASTGPSASSYDPVGELESSADRSLRQIGRSVRRSQLLIVNLYINHRLRDNLELHQSGWLPLPLPASTRKVKGMDAKASRRHEWVEQSIHMLQEGQVFAHLVDMLDPGLLHLPFFLHTKQQDHFQGNKMRPELICLVKALETCGLSGAKALLRQQHEHRGPDGPTLIHLAWQLINKLWLQPIRPSALLPPDIAALRLDLSSKWNQQPATNVDLHSTLLLRWANSHAASNSLLDSFDQSLDSDLSAAVAHTAARRHARTGIRFARAGSSFESSLKREGAQGGAAWLRRQPDGVRLPALRAVLKDLGTDGAIAAEVLKHLDGASRALQGNEEEEACLEVIGALGEAFYAALFACEPVLQFDDLRFSPRLSSAPSIAAAIRAWVARQIKDPVTEGLPLRCRSGLLLLQLIDSLRPGVVDWALVHRKPRRRVQCVLNCALMLELLDQKLGFRCPDVSAKDIADADSRAVRTVIGKLMNWDLLRCALPQCPPLAGGTVIGVANMLVNWHISQPHRQASMQASVGDDNGRHSASKPAIQRITMPTTCDDPSLADGVWLIAFVGAVLAAGSSRIDSHDRKQIREWLRECTAIADRNGGRGVHLCAGAIAAAQMLGVQSLIGPEDVLHGRCDLVRAFIIETITTVPREYWPSDQLGRVLRV